MRNEYTMQVTGKIFEESVRNIEESVRNIEQLRWNYWIVSTANLPKKSLNFLTNSSVFLTNSSPKRLSNNT